MEYINGKMHYRIYLDNQIVTYILRLIQKNPSKNVHIIFQQASLVFLDNIKSVKFEYLISEESLAEIRKLPQDSIKRKDLELLYFIIKEGKSVIRNSSVTWDDPIATWDSPDVFWDHNKTDNDLNKVIKFFKSVGNTNEFDARYIANAMLPENKIDYFVTSDKKTIWRFKTQIEQLFGVKVRLPSELVEYFEYLP